MNNVTEAPEKWVILEIGSYYKVFGTWTYNGKCRMNSGIAKVEQDGDYYYFTGFSGSCYKCHKKGYGVTFYGSKILSAVLESGRAVLLEGRKDWAKII